MKLIPMLLVLATVASLAPSVSAQDGLNRGRKGSEPKPSAPSRPQTNGDRGRQQGSPSTNDRSAAPRPTSRDQESRDRNSYPRQEDRGNVAPRSTPPVVPIINEQRRGEAWNSRSPQDGLNRGKGSGGGGSSGGSGPRPSNPQPRPQRNNDDQDRSPRSESNSGQNPLSRAPQGRTRDSRSGTVRYESSNNQFGTRSNTSRVVAPSIPNDARVARGSLRQPAARVNNDWRHDDRGWRDGYWQYNRSWRDDYFRYPHYQFAYRPGYCPSPWYGYVNLPAYIDPSRCLNSVSVNFGWGLGIRYTWSSYNDYSQRRSRTYDRVYTQPIGYGDLDLDYAVSGIQNGFRNRDMAQFDTLLPRGDSVYVDLGDRPGYNLRNDDFYDMLNDVVNATTTLSYSIVDVYNNGRESTVVADHRFTDAWGGTVVQRHWFGLARDRYGYRIVSFRTSGRY